MSEFNPKIPTPTPLLRLFSQPQIPSRKFFFCLHHPHSLTMILVFQPSQCCRAINPHNLPAPAPGLRGTSERIQSRGLYKQSTFPHSSLHEFHLATCPIFNNPTSTSPNPNPTPPFL